ncbi:MAG: class II aldolase/adducin family protein, partial [Thermoplasmatota archaeon]
MPTPVYLGHEASRAPVVADLVAAAKACVAAGATSGALSARYGPRCVINAETLLETLGPDHFVEVADYDAHNDHVLVLGSSPPSSRAAIHSLLYRAKREIGAIVELDADADALATLPQVKRGRT